MDDSCNLLGILGRHAISGQQIAWSVGYEDPGAFRKVFQKVIGLSPGDYRRRFAVGLNVKNESASAADVIGPTAY
ncbi:MAG TPA: helix-turn-helix domain-containing protein [Dongiaceae bacterium]